MKVMVTAGMCPWQNSGGVTLELASYCNISLEKRGDKK